MRFFYLLAVGVFAGSCAGQSAGQDANAPIKIEMSQMFVTVKNDSGMALSDITVTIVPMGRTTLYTEFVGRMESAETRKIMLGDFNGRDGTPFSLRVVKPKTVQVKGTDVSGKAHDVEVDWK
ncbi:MAG: hypothetical protein ND807_08900 [Vicinamibacterales bacterium]|nr:hypothetical protein [Vicinamibacterales bacterium]